jgi:hypothetical protein
VEASEDLGRHPVWGRQGARVQIGGGGHPGVAKPASDRLRVDAGGEELACDVVTEVVLADIVEADLICETSEPACAEIGSPR